MTFLLVVRCSNREERMSASPRLAFPPSFTFSPSVFDPRFWKTAAACLFPPTTPNKRYIHLLLYSLLQPELPPRNFWVLLLLSGPCVYNITCANA